MGRGGIWLHAVSVGEALSAARLTAELKKTLPETPVVISTGTATGQALAVERAPADGFFYAPLDVPWAVRSGLAALQPRLLIVLETEIWPCLFREAKRFGASLLIANARMSDRSWPRYRRFRGLFRPTLECADMILAQSAEDGARFCAAGAPPERVEIAGNLKYDFEPAPSAAPPEIVDFLNRLGASPIVLAGSTREGEEAPVATAFRQATAGRSKALLIVAPRHPQRFAEAERALGEAGLTVVRRSRLGDSALPSAPAALLIDSLGELASLYPLADAVFVGGSLNGWGGHNVLEPALAGRPVVVGPTMQNFRDIASRLLEAGGLLEVRSAAELAPALKRLLEDPDEAKQVGERARRAAEAERGAAARIADVARQLWLAGSPQRPPPWPQRLALAPLAAAWGVGVHSRAWAYRRRLLKPQRLARPAICIGSLSAGGSGKTPLVLWLAERLLQRGRRPAVLSRGYRRRSRQPLAFLPEDSWTAAEVGDEPALLLGRLRAAGLGVPLGVAADRAAAARLVLERAEIDVFILDDGYQRLSLERDVNLLLVDVSRPTGEPLLPLGLARETEPAASRADGIVFTRAVPGCCYDHRKRRLRRWNPAAPVWLSRFETDHWLEPESGAVEPVATLVGRRVLAFCGIGAPEAFRRSLQQSGVEIAGFMAFPDHHRYGLDDLRRVRAAFDRAGADFTVTTEKDLVNLPPREQEELSGLRALIGSVAVDRQEELLDWLEERLERRR